ncbi:MAG TPA: flavin reductase [Anaerolineales bacterium]|nr:flavin reductase [Anaerolineales bacterium]
MTPKPISIEEFMIRPMHLWDIQWLLLTSGDFFEGRFNAMTVGWGSIGYMWRRPFVQVVVRPIRYTYEFMERYDTFTLCAFPKKYHSALQLLGNKSGRDGDKITEAGLTPAASIKIAAPGYAEAELILECRKMYWDDVHPEHFPDLRIDANYPDKDYHRIYFGEILYVLGDEKFVKN